MDERALTFLRRLLDAPGPSGYETAPARVWRGEAETFADEVTHDVLGNSYARLKNEGAPVVVIEGHIDEIGLLITHIDEQGFLWFEHIGGWDNQVLVGQRIRISGNDGDVIGVIGRKAKHLLGKGDEDRAAQTRDLWIDIGAKDRADALQRVSIGDPAVVHADFVSLTGDLCVSRSMDNRVGAFVALEAVRLLATDRPALDIYALAPTQEEISFAGAYTSTFRLAPKVAIAIDVTHATDAPTIDKKETGEHALGSGPVITRGATLSSRVCEMLIETAEAEGMDYTLEASGRGTHTDADAIQLARGGIASGVVSIPLRYMHSSVEMVQLSDVEAVIELLVAFAGRVKPDVDLNR